MADLETAFATLRERGADEDRVRVWPTDVLIDGSPLLAGIDHAGHRHLLVPVALKSRVREDRRSRGVHVMRSELVHDGQRRAFVDLESLDPGLDSVFMRLASEVIEEIQADPARAPLAPALALERWRELLLRPRSELSREQKLGLFAEMLHVDRVLALGGDPALSFWTGPSKSAHDLEVGDVAVEVKASAHSATTAEVHGVGQLDCTPDRTLFLSLVLIDADPNGFGVAELRDRLRERGAILEELDARLEAVGWTGDDNERFAVRTWHMWQVTSDVPKIVASSFVGGRMPVGTDRLRYTVDLDREPLAPLPPDAVQLAFERLAGTA